jgi:hypothetical protein
MTCAAKCFYCENQLSPRHEHDHFPVPARLGGDRTVCSCINCHDLKDRIPLNDWPMEALREVLGLENMWSKLSTTQRIFLGKLIAVALDWKPPASPA